MTQEEKLVTIAENVPKVYEAGKQAEYDKFWDAAQQNGNRINYNYAFAGQTWNNVTFKPKYNIVPTTASHLFNASMIEGDLVEILSSFGVTLDLSNATTASSVFANSYYITRVGVVSAVSVSAVQYFFQYCSGLRVIDKLILKNDGSQTFTGNFVSCETLEEIKEIEGVIGQNGFDIHWSTKLSHDSLMRIINALQDKSGTTGSWVCTLGATNLAKLTDAEKAIATQKGWSLA